MIAKKEKRKNTIGNISLGAIYVYLRLFSSNKIELLACNSSICDQRSFDPVEHVTGITLASFSIDFLRNTDCSPQCSSSSFFFSLPPTLRRDSPCEPENRRRWLATSCYSARDETRSGIDSFTNVRETFHIARISLEFRRSCTITSERECLISCIAFKPVIHSIDDHMIVDRTNKSKSAMHADREHVFAREFLYTGSIVDPMST